LARYRDVLRSFLLEDLNMIVNFFTLPTKKKLWRRSTKERRETIDLQQQNQEVLIIPETLKFKTSSRIKNETFHEAEKFKGAYALQDLQDFFRRGEEIVRKKDGSKVGTNSTTHPITLDNNLTVNVSVDVRATSPNVGADIGMNISEGSSKTVNVGPDIDRNVVKVPLNLGKRQLSYLVGPTGNGADVVVSLESVRAVANSVYGFFLGKRMAYPVFSSKDGMNVMLENGPWFIHSIQLILKKWTSDANLLKEDVCNVPVWIIFHDVPIMAFSEDGLKSWGRSSYTKAMIKLQADVELKDTIVVDFLKLVGEGFLCALYVLSMSGNLQNLSNPRQAVRGVQVGPKLGFKPTNC
ncbi:integrase, catalytic region, zinc finger, CCHC-type containing protein, partial [Tanacetum coccineum]